MPNADGSIIIKADVDDKDAEKRLNQLNRTIEKTEKELSKLQAKKLPLAKQAEELTAELDKAKERLAYMQSGVEFFPVASIKAQENSVKAMQKDWDGLQDKLDGVNGKIKYASGELLHAKEEAGELAKKMTSVGYRTKEAMDEMTKKVDKFSDRLKKLAKRVFLFSLFTMALRSMREWLGKVIKTNAEATSAIARLKGALLTLAQPLLSVIIPALTALVNILTRVVSAVASLISMLFGKGIKQTKQAAKAMYNEAEAIEAAGAAADEAAGSFASFDEINQLSDNGGGSGASVSAPDFDFDTSTMEADFEKLLGWIKLIGAGLLAWKLSDSFLGGLKTFVGLIIAFNGAIEMAKGTWDAWQNGMNGDNLTQMLKGALQLALGLGIAFGTVGAAIGFVVGGLTLLATSIHDAMENGWNLQNLLGSIAGMLMGGLGIALLTGSWIPLLIAGIASVLLALAVNTGHGEELIAGIRQVCQGFVDFITGIFTGDIDKALTGISGIFDGLGVVVNAVILGLRDTILSFLDWLDQKTGGKFHDTIEKAKNFVVGFFEDAQAFAAETIENIKLIFGGIVEFIAGVFTNDWDMAWEGLKKIFKGCINGIIAIFEAMINNIVGGLNIITRGIKAFTAFSLPDWMGGYKFEGISIPEIPKVSLPRLATGAVVPPNREFMAVLGDNKRETEVVSPLSTMKQAMLEAMRESGGMGGELVIKIKPSPGMARYLKYELDNETTRQGGKLVVQK